MAKPGWGILIQGEAFDLEDWKMLLKEPFDPWVEIHGTDLVLRSASLDELTTANEVHDQSDFLIKILNGAMALSQKAKPITFAGVAEISTDGSVHKTAFLRGSIQGGRSRAQGFATVTGGPPPPKPSDAQDWVALAENEKWLEDALVHFGATDWFDIYKALECLECRFGGTPKKFLALNWASEAEIERLKHTANWSRRHAKRKFKAPKKEMELTEARELLARLLRRAFDELPVTPPPKR